MIGSNLHRFYKGKYLFFDKETEGVNLGFSKPWQLAWAIADNHKILDIQVRFIKWPDLNISKGAAAITGFDRREYDRLAIDPAEVFDEFSELLLDPQYSPVGHNILGFDIYIYKVFAELLNKKIDFSFLDRAIDTNCLAKAYKKGFKIDTDNLLQSQLRLVNYIEKGLKTNLTAMGKEFNIPFDYKSLHRAENDLKLNHLVYKELLWKLDF